MTENVEKNGAGAESKPVGGDGADVKLLIGKLERLERINRVMRIVLPVVLLLIIFLVGASTYKSVRGAFTQDRVTDSTVKAGEDLLPVMNRMLDEFVQDVGPQFSNALHDRLEKYSEELGQRLAEHLDRLERQNRNSIEEQAKAAVKAQQASHKELLLKVMPELANDPETLEMLSKRLNAAFELWTVTYMLGMVEDYYHVMGKINQTITENFRTKPGEQPPTVVGSKESEMLELFMEILNTSFDEEPSPVAPAPAKAEEAKETAPAEAAPAEAAPAEAAPAEAAPAGEKVEDATQASN